MRQQAAAEAEKQGRHARRVQGQLRANIGANGITLEGSALDVMENSAANAALDRQRLLYAGELKAIGFESTAALDRSAGDAAQTAGYMGAASSLLIGASKLPKSSLSGRTSSAGYQLGDYSYSTANLA